MNRSEIEKISKALADETCLRIFEAVSATKHINCGEIVSMRGATPATVSALPKRLIGCCWENQNKVPENAMARPAMPAPNPGVTGPFPGRWKRPAGGGPTLMEKGERRRGDAPRERV